MNKHRLLHLSFIVALIPQLVHAERITIGHTYPIKEKDALLEIEERAAKADISQVMNKSPDSWSAVHSVKLPRAQENSERKHTPIYVTEFDVPKKDGTILYPKGYKFNPLDYVTLPSNIFVVDESDAQWVSQHASEFDMVIISNGDRVKLSAVLERPVFILDAKTKERLSIKSVPTMVTQKSNYLLVREYKVEVSDG